MAKERGALAIQQLQHQVEELLGTNSNHEGEKNK